MFFFQVAEKVKETQLWKDLYGNDPNIRFMEQYPTWKGKVRDLEGRVMVMQWPGKWCFIIVVKFLSPGGWCAKVVLPNEDGEEMILSKHVNLKNSMETDNLIYLKNGIKNLDYLRWIERLFSIDSSIDSSDDSFDVILDSKDSSDDSSDSSEDSTEESSKKKHNDYSATDSSTESESDSSSDSQ